MSVVVYVPPQAAQVPVPVVWYRSGLTCTHINVTEKAGAQRICAELGVMFVAPDTSPRGEGVPDDAEGAYDFGLGAGFYVDATEQRSEEHTSELQSLMRISYAVFCLKKKKHKIHNTQTVMNT